MLHLASGRRCPPAPKKPPSEPPTASTEIVPAPSQGALGLHVERVRKYAARSRAESTRDAYRRDFARFDAWCREQPVPSLPASVPVVLDYLTALADGEVRVRWRAGRSLRQDHETRAPKGIAAIRRSLTSIAVTHRLAGHDWPYQHPAIVETMSGIARTLRDDKRHRKMPIEVGPLVRCLARYQAPTEMAALRDRAVILAGFFGALRRSDAARLVAPVQFVEQGMILTLPISKTNQSGEPEQIAVPFASNHDVCPVRAMHSWLDASGITEGPLFRAVDRFGRIGRTALNGRTIALIVKRIATAGGLDPAKCGGHSLRSGFATTAGPRKSLASIMRQGRWRSERTALGYIRPTKAFDDNAAEGLA